MKQGPAPQIIVDTREQRPWSFPAEVRVKRATLPAGDYSVAGLEDSVAIERKSLPDLVQSVTYERERFWAELERLRDYFFRIVIVEASPADIFAGAYRSQTRPRSVWASVLAISSDFGIPVLLAGDVHEAARSGLWMLQRVARRLEVPVPPAPPPAPHASAGQLALRADAEDGEAPPWLAL